MVLLVFEFLGTTELLVILVVALVLFGPRKLPELGRSLGKSLAEFKRATDDFKQTWEREVDMDRFEREMRLEKEALGTNLVGGSNVAALNGQPSAATNGDTVDARETTMGGTLAEAQPINIEQQTIARTTTAAAAVTPTTTGVRATEAVDSSETASPMDDDHDQETPRREQS